MLSLTCTTITQVVMELYNNQLLNDYLNYLNSRLKNDMKNELILQLLEHEKKTMMQYKQGFLFYYVFSALKKMTYPTSSFYKKYVTYDELSENWSGGNNNDSKELQERQHKEDIFDLCKNYCVTPGASDKKKQIQKIVFELYFDRQLSLRQIQKCTGINYRQIWEYIQVIKENIKNNINYKKYDDDNN